MCEACGGPIFGAAVLVPRFPRGAFRYCNLRSCQSVALRRAAVAFPRLSGTRGKRATQQAPA